jgi:hypothetical protein
MSTTTVRDRSQISKDPQAKRVIQFDWDEELATGVTISASTWTITGPDTALTKDNEAVATGNRQSSVRLIGGTVGATYTLTNHVTTNESPAQEDDASVDVFIRQR